MRTNNTTDCQECAQNGTDDKPMGDRTKSPQIRQTSLNICRTRSKNGVRPKVLEFVPEWVKITVNEFKCPQVKNASPGPG